MEKFGSLLKKCITLMGILAGLSLLYCIVDFSLSYSDLSTEIKQIDKITEWQKTNITGNYDGTAINAHPLDFSEFLNSIPGHKGKYFSCVEAMLVGMALEELENDNFGTVYFYLNFALQSYGELYKELTENDMTVLSRKFCGQLFLIFILFGVSLALIVNYFDKNRTSQEGFSVSESGVTQE